MAGERGLVHHDDVVAEKAVMRDVAIGHDEILITKRSGRAFLGAAVDGDELPDDILRTDLGKGRLALIGEILGFMTNHGIHVDCVVIPKFGPAGEVNAGQDLVVGADLDPVFDDDVRADRVIDPDLDMLSDDGARVDLRHERDYITMV